METTVDEGQIFELLAPIRALAILLPEAVGFQSYHARVLCTQLSPKELEALHTFIKAGQQCIAKLKQSTLDGLRRVLSSTRPQNATASIALPNSGDSKAGVYELFEEYDLNADGALSLDEFTRACKVLLGSSMTDEQIVALMTHSDANASGDLDIHEFIVWLYGEPMIRQQTEASMLPVGTRVRIGGLKGAVELNGKIGVVRGATESSGRCIVEVEGLEGQQKSLRAQNLTPIGGGSHVGREENVRAKRSVELPKISAERSQARGSTPQKEVVYQPPQDIRVGDFNIGDRVRVGGLNGTKDLNGQIAVIFGLDKASGRYIIEFENGAGQKKLRRENLTAMGNATGAIAAKARMMAGI